jgi:hypothetical protein
MNPSENEAPKTPSSSDASNDLTPEAESSMDANASDSAQLSSDPNDPRSPGIQDRKGIPQMSPESQEAIRELVKPKQNEPTTPGDSRSPGIAERDATVPEPTASSNEQDTVRKLIVTDPNESESDSSDTK